ncbi:MAG: hypothetical protein AAF533_05015 [Acidobacteriota bacterium]
MLRPLGLLLAWSLGTGTAVADLESVLAAALGWEVKAVPDPAIEFLFETGPFLEQSGGSGYLRVLSDELGHFTSTNVAQRLILASRFDDLADPTAECQGWIFEPLVRNDELSWTKVVREYQSEPWLCARLTDKTTDESGLQAIDAEARVRLQDGTEERRTARVSFRELASVKETARDDGKVESWPITLLTSKAGRVVSAEKAPEVIRPEWDSELLREAEELLKIPTVTTEWDQATSMRTFVLTREDLAPLIELIESANLTHETKTHISLLGPGKGHRLREHVKVKAPGG